MNNAVSLFGVTGVKEVEPVLDDPINYLSFYDLDGVVGFQSCKETQNKQELERILWEHGADITKPYFIKKSLHRPQTSNKAYDGFRVEFSERRDKEWLRSGAASLEAQLFTTDESLASELASLDPRNRVNNKRDFEDDIELDIELPEGLENSEVMD